VITYCGRTVHRDACRVHRGRDLLQSESNKIRLLNELDRLEETIVRRQRDLEEVLDRHKTDLAAVQIQVSHTTLPFINMLSVCLSPSVCPSVCDIEHCG